ncbi:aminodeoxychorismate lyase [Malassezia nana]|uniref:Aminodeoxychorismate lyase n=1 Tax=Malassezia nana TaxID=180528 RepID=A0AAF0ETV0_9BASI|nr:aminodeoxychorismate lyase [Malassezia nana]
MVQTVARDTSYAYPWTACVQAFFRRYPNPQALHVLTVDVVDRHLEIRPPRTAGGAPTPVLCTSRLLLKRGSLPKWAPAGIIKKSTSWVLEESEVDLSPGEDGAPRTMAIWTRNLDHTAVLAITESLRFTEGTSVDPPTHCHTAAHVRSDVSFRLLRGRIEKFGLKRYLAHWASSQQGLVWAIHQIAPEISRGPAPVLPMAVAPPAMRSAS